MVLNGKCLLEKLLNAEKCDKGAKNSGKNFELKFLMSDTLPLRRCSLHP